MTTTTTFSEQTLELLEVIVNNDVTITRKINLGNDMITDTDGNGRKLSEADVYAFQAMIQDVKVTPELMKALLNSNYFKSTYISTTAGAYNVPFDKYTSYFFLFSSLIIPYQMVDIEKYKKPSYANDIQNVFNKYNNVSIYYMKNVLRYILVVPGIVVTPFILLAVLSALKKMS